MLPVALSYEHWLIDGLTGGPAQLTGQHAAKSLQRKGCLQDFDPAAIELVGGTARKLTSGNAIVGTGSVPV